MTLRILINEILRTYIICDVNKIDVMVLSFLLVLSANIYLWCSYGDVNVSTHLILFVFGTSTSLFGISTFFWYFFILYKKKVLLYSFSDHCYK